MALVVHSINLLSCFSARDRWWPATSQAGGAEAVCQRRWVSFGTDALGVAGQLTVGAAHNGEG